MAWVQRKQDKFEQALANLKKVSELDPLSNELAWEFANMFRFLRKYTEAERYYDRAISLAPDMSIAYKHKAWVYLCWQGKTEKARAILEEALQNIKSKENPFTNLLATLDVYDRNYQEALDRLSLKSEDVVHNLRFIPHALRLARIYGYMDKKQMARKYYDEARTILEAKIQQRPEDDRFHRSLGIAYAGLGRKEDAIREGKKGVELLPVTKDAWSGPLRVKDLALIYAMVGEFDAAIDQLEFLLKRPGWISVPLLQLDPDWDPLRDHPRFKKLIQQDNPKK
jgi:tetratricopeptide (TPR) repeat protein